MADGTFVWLPGWSAAPAVWRREIERWPGADHVAVDFSGCAGHADFPAVAQRAVEDADPPVRVVAWSLGAMVALELAGASTLYLIGASPRFVRDETGEGGWPSRVLRRMHDRLLADRDEVLEAFVRQMFTEAEAQAGHLEAWRAAYAFGWPTAALRAGLDYLSGFSLIAPPEAPAFLLHGAADAICPLAGADRLTELLPVCELTAWDACGHVPFWTDPERFHAWLQESIEP